MTSKHTHSIHVDAPLEKVFAYLAEPVSFMETVAASDDAKVVKVDRNADGTVASYEVKYREMGMHITSSMTREEFVADERIVDRSSTGPVWTITVTPEGEGAMVTVSWDASRLMKMFDAVFLHSDRGFGSAMEVVKKEIEALP